MTTFTEEIEEEEKNKTPLNMGTATLLLLCVLSHEKAPTPFAPLKR